MLSWFFRPAVLLPPAGVEGAATGAPGRPARLHPGHGGVQEGMRLLQWADLPSGVDRWTAAPPQLSSSSGPAPPRTAGTLCGKTPLSFPRLLLPSSLFSVVFMSSLAVSWRRRRLRADEVPPGGGSVCAGHKEFTPLSKLDIRTCQNKRLK